jgi:hypothetical protein
MGEILVGYPGDDAVSTAVISMTSPDVFYPATNLQGYDPANPTKATNTATVITITCSGSKTPEGFAIINHNLFGASVTLANGAGLSESITIPARTSDGQCVNAWHDLRLAANRTASVFTLSITGASANVAIGRLCLVTTMRELPWMGEGVGVGYGATWPVRELRTFYGSSMMYDTGIRVRSARGQTVQETDRVMLMTLAQSAKGVNIPFLFVPDEDVNDAWYVRLSQSTVDGLLRVDGVIADQSIGVTEVSMGLPL